MTQRLAGKKAFVTGAAQGIGRACAEAFAREGAEVVATDVDQTTLATLEGFPGIGTAALDVGDPVAIIRLAQEVGPVDVIMNVAAIVHEGSILDCTDDDWDGSFAVNAKSVHRVMRAFLPGLIEGGGGSIINVVSTHGMTRGGPGRYAYAATKGAVASLTRATALDLIRMNVRCNCIAPGPVLSPSFLRRFETPADGTDVQASTPTLQQVADMHPLGRIGTPAEVAPYAVFLASDESSYVTGTTQLIDGGWSL
ncbi:2-keto-3-deoxy-L-fuconate dehydrogenase [Marmoricola sp. URHA0025 HA25]